MGMVVIGGGFLVVIYKYVCDCFEICLFLPQSFLDIYFTVNTPLL